MIRPVISPEDEDRRLSALARCALLNKSREEDFDKVTRLVSAICEVPIAIISFVDGDREWFKSVVGIAIDGIARDDSFCAHAISEPGQVFVVSDALLDPRFWSNPYVLGEPHVRFYAGAPLRTTDGCALGTLCAIDYEPRSLAPKQLWALQTAARSIVTLLEHREIFGELEGAQLRPSAEPEQIVRVPMESRHGNPFVAQGALATAAQLRALPADIVDAVPGIFYLVESSGAHLLWNKRLEEVSGYSAEELARISPLDLIAAKDRTYVADRIRHAFVHGTAFADASLATKDGQEIPYYFTATNVEYENRICLAGVGIDNSERKKAEDLLKYAALHDPLTGLGNRTVLFDRLARATRATIVESAQTAVLFLDLDHFKLMNDTLGHSWGDELLKAVAQRIRGSIRADDMVVRLGGDEFVVVADITGSEDVDALVGTLKESFRKPFSVNGHVLHLTTSIGISLFPSDGTEPDHLLRNADTAMYHAKELGRNTAQFFTSEMHAVAVNRLATEMDLRHGLDNGEFELFYQPVLDLRSGRTVSAEALIRWNHPKRGRILPREFITIAEEIGLIVPIGAWVIREGSREAARLAELNLECRSISLNVSGRQLRDPTFIDEMRTALCESHPAIQSLGIEITESAALGDPDRAFTVLQRCKELGLIIFLDDFGTHNSSLTYLKRFPVDVIKIDKSFVDGLPDDANDTGIVRAILALARASGCEVIAEGVESAVQAKWLLENGCFYCAGFYVARPMPASEFEEWLRGYPTMAASGQYGD